MPTEELNIDPNMQETSEAIELVMDAALVDFNGTPAFSDPLLVNRIGMWTLFVVAVPEGSQEIKLEVQTSPDADRSSWYTEPDMNSDDMDANTYTFKATTNPPALEIGPLYGATMWLRIRYGYNGGTGSGASLRVTIMGRAQ
jgi:hypothetical protein